MVPMDGNIASDFTHRKTRQSQSEPFNQRGCTRLVHMGDLVGSVADVFVGTGPGPVARHSFISCELLSSKWFACSGFRHPLLRSCSRACDTSALKIPLNPYTQGRRGARPGAVYTPSHVGDIVSRLCQYPFIHATETTSGDFHASKQNEQNNHT
jgi:hypothetical protein